MIRARIVGGLGNQLFQYATARRLSKKLDTKLELDLTKFSDDPLRRPIIQEFKLADDVAICCSKHEAKRKKVLAKLSGGYVNYQQLKFNEKILDIKRNVTLYGYFQSALYFTDCREVLLDEIQLIESSPIDSFAKELLNLNSVAIHIRRGDYLKPNLDFGLCAISYYLDAMATMEALVGGIQPVIFTDDLDWFFSSFPDSERFLVGSKECYSDAQELILMSRCKHQIIANSSFSWWGAWLNRNPEKVVIAPKPWFDGKRYRENSIVPDEWIEMPKR